MATTHRAVVAIDLGTSNSGAAYAYCSDDRRLVRGVEFPGGGVKVPTSVLVALKSPHDGVEIGPDVINAFDEDEHAIFHRFKMQLHDKPDSKYIEADVGKLRLPTITVMARTLELLKNKTLRQAKERGLPFEAAEALWVVTVPAIWTEGAKSMVREAAHQAGLVESHVSERLLLALEPECAAMQCQEDHELLTRGRRYAVLDCGGGTIDTTVYTVNSVEPLDLRELHRASGGGWGSTGIDRALVELLKEMLGDLRSLRRNSLALFDFLTAEWEVKKMTFTQEQAENPNGKVTLSLRSLLDDEDDFDLAAAVKRYNERHPNQPPVKKFGASNIKLPSAVMNQLFDSVLDPIRQHVRDLLRQVRNLDYMMVVGGFGGSTVLQHAVRQQLEGSSTKMLTMDKSSVAIVRGAVLFGLTPRAIRERRARLTYGIETSTRFVEGRHPSARKEWDERKQEHRVNKVFRQYVKMNDAVDIDKKVRHTFYPVYDDQTTVTFNIMAVDRREVDFVDERGVKKLGSLKLTCLEAGPGVDRELLAEMSFGATEIIVKVTSASTRDVQRVPIQFFK